MPPFCLFCGMSRQSWNHLGNGFRWNSSMDGYVFTSRATFRRPRIVISLAQPASDLLKVVRELEELVGAWVTLLLPHALGCTLPTDVLDDLEAEFVPLRLVQPCRLGRANGRGWGEWADKRETGGLGLKFGRKCCKNQRGVEGAYRRLLRHRRHHPERHMRPSYQPACSTKSGSMAAKAEARSRQ